MPISSLIGIDLGTIPQVDDPSLYSELLDVHNAIEIILEAVARERESLHITTDYFALLTDSLILADSTAGVVTVTLPAAASVEGYSYVVKRTAGASDVIVEGTAGELIDTVASKTLAALESATFKSDGEAWWII